MRRSLWDALRPHPTEPPKELTEYDLEQRAKGLCYEHSGRYVMTHDGDKRVVLVHGSANLTGLKAVNHAWVLVDGEIVFDRTLAPPAFYAKDAYYDLAEAVEHRRYSSADARCRSCSTCTTTDRGPRTTPPDAKRWRRHGDTGRLVDCRRPVHAHRSLDARHPDGSL